MALLAISAEAFRRAAETDSGNASANGFRHAEGSKELSLKEVKTSHRRQRPGQRFRRAPSWSVSSLSSSVLIGEYPGSVEYLLVTRVKESALFVAAIQGAYGAT